jgi:hypothetical protein
MLAVNCLHHGMPSAFMFSLLPWHRRLMPVEIKIQK